MTTSFRGHIQSEDLAITQEASFVNSPDWATTSTSWQTTDLTFLIHLNDAHPCVSLTAELVVEHTVAAATFDAEITLAIDDAESSAYTFALKSGIYVPAANARVAVTLSANYDVRANLANIVLPGDRRARLLIKNNTAGTLTLRGQRLLHGFTVGDDTE